MRPRAQSAALAGFCALACLLSAGILSGQQASAPGDVSAGAEGRVASRAHPRTRKPVGTLTADDGLAVIAAALDAKVRRDSAHDCSHLVNAIYRRAGFPYAYASSNDLYDGVEGFRRVSDPQPGDIIVWRGHAGIVVHPSRHVFFSFLTAGPTTDNYSSRYWVARGYPRFYRYVKGDPCAGCTSISALRQNR
jgi:cell wall-associated NlpC family hydrolase